ncbi:hypothetical protein [Nocardia farcinica]|uniref:hypothetical protein n=1 Tax=Nocardia farcinica TaxID=37329 RepID=UPI0024582AD3|nr:hypothetical protein [Nocardia farcinica]
MQMIERRVLEDYNSGARRVSCLFRNESGRDIVRPRWNLDEIRSEVATRTDDFERKQFHAYLFDTLELELDLDGSIPPDELRQSRNRFAAELGAGDFFEGYCAARAIDARGVERLAEDLLDRTEEHYMSTLRAVFGGAVGQDEFARFYSALLTVDAGSYSVDRIHRDLQCAVEEHGYGDRIEVVRGSPPGVSTTVSTIDPRKSTVFLAEYGGLESYRAAFHALGHAMYAVSLDVSNADLVGVNISATEVSAFSAQELALESLAPEHRKMLDFMPTYYARMYALRLLDEARFYREGMASTGCPREYERRLLIVPKSAFTPRSRLHAVDFVIAFSAYLLRGRTGSLEDVRRSVVSNGQLLMDSNCLMEGFVVTPERRAADRSEAPSVGSDRKEIGWSNSSVME